MIETMVLCYNPTIIYQRIIALNDDNATAYSVQQALDVVESVQTITSTFNLLLDFSAADTTLERTLSAHRIWAIGFKENVVVRKGSRYVAVVAENSPIFRSEKMVMENDTCHFFNDVQEALIWLKSFNSR